MNSSALIPSRFNRRAFALVLSPFALFGTVFGVWLTLLADLQRVLTLSPGMLGAAFTAGLVVSLPSMVLAGRLADHWGERLVIVGSGVLIGAALIGAASATSYVRLCATFLLFYAATGAFDVGINAAAMRLEQASGTRVISYFHAAFNGFAALSALLVGALLAFAVPFRALYGGVTLLTFALALWWWRALPRADTVHAEASPQPSASRTPRNLYRSPALLLLAVTAALAFLAEGEMGNWAGVYLRGALGFPVMVGVLGFAAFHGAMCAGRLLGGRLILSWGRRRLLTLSGLAVLAGMALALSTLQAPLAVTGFLLVGAALSVVGPVVYSLAGDLVPGRAGEASSVVTTLGYGGYLLGPALVGGVAELVGLRWALVSVALAGGLIAGLSWWVYERPSSMVELPQRV